MNNTFESESHAKHCLYFTKNDFEKIFIDIFGPYNSITNAIDVEFYSPQGIQNIHFRGVTTKEVYEKLSEYFYIDVVSIHLDQNSDPGVWICFIPKETKKEEVKETEPEETKSEITEPCDDTEQEYIVPVEWGMSGFVKVMARNANEAYNKVLLDDDDYDLPYDSSYIDGTFKPYTETGIDTGKIVDMYTKEWKAGRLNLIIE